MGLVAAPSLGTWPLAGIPAPLAVTGHVILVRARATPCELCLSRGPAAAAQATNPTSALWRAPLPRPSPAQPPLGSLCLGPSLERGLSSPSPFPPSACSQV